MSILLIDDGVKRWVPRPLVASCGVCSSPATDVQHYGSVSCYSCRAFFRRSVGSGKVYTSCARQSDNCVIDPVNRTNCKKCRFRKCLEIGMKPEKVDRTSKSRGTDKRPIKTPSKSPKGTDTHETKKTRSEDRPRIDIDSLVDACFEEERQQREIAQSQSCSGGSPPDSVARNLPSDGSSTDLMPMMEEEPVTSSENDQDTNSMPGLDLSHHHHHQASVKDLRKGVSVIRLNPNSVMHGWWHRRLDNSVSDSINSPCSDIYPESSTSPQSLGLQKTRQSDGYCEENIHHKTEESNFQIKTSGGGFQPTTPGVIQRNYSKVAHHPSPLECQTEIACVSATSISDFSASNEILSSHITEVPLVIPDHQMRNEWGPEANHQIVSVSHGNINVRGGADHGDNPAWMQAGWNDDRIEMAFKKYVTEWVAEDGKEYEDKAKLAVNSSAIIMTNFYEERMTRFNGIAPTIDLDLSLEEEFKVHQLYYLRTNMTDHIFKTFLKLPGFLEYFREFLFSINKIKPKRLSGIGIFEFAQRHRGCARSKLEDSLLKFIYDEFDVRLYDEALETVRASVPVMHICNRAFLKANKDKKYFISQHQCAGSYNPGIQAAYDAVVENYPGLQVCSFDPFDFDLFVSPWAVSYEDEVKFIQTIERLGNLVKDDVKLGTIYLFLLTFTPSESGSKQSKEHPQLVKIQKCLSILLYRYLKNKHGSAETAIYHANSLFSLIKDIHECGDIHLHRRIIGEYGDNRGGELEELLTTQDLFQLTNES